MGWTMVHREAAATHVTGGARDAGSGAPAFDEHTFDQAYFGAVSNYGGRYDRYNPPHKIAGYLREIRRLRPRGALLDVGCAFGRFLERARQHYQCEGVDISAYALSLAEPRLPGVPLHHSAIQTFHRGRTFDVITCFDVLEHVPDLPRALGRLRELLAPDGILAIAVPVYDTLPGRLFGIIDRDPTHIHRNSRVFWLEQLRETGFEPIIAKGILRAPLPGGFIHAISRLFWRFSSAIFVIGTRRGTADHPLPRDAAAATAR